MANMTDYASKRWLVTSSVDMSEGSWTEVFWSWPQKGIEQIGTLVPMTLAQKCDYFKKFTVATVLGYGLPSDLAIKRQETYLAGSFMKPIMTDFDTM